MTKCRKPRHIVRTPGVYRTKDGDQVRITRIVGGRAYGCFPNSADSTWWYADTGEHGLYTPDDLIERLDGKLLRPKK